ncbi:glycosyltransferase [Draconibacterium halophilum]|uniref:Glycosyltransferase n=1 Tax=Draconibacterium halophilum TaxID=2706887 RepID=A0A6C0RIQ0_9BACT|nr:glycosyltransferase family 2 protein [Draconibacterium halophilum]QIA09021.1 glycosyltransferase [Draconibacterium halophilum]
MIIAAWIIFIFTAIQLWVVLLNAIFRQPLSASSKDFNPLISILIPARNEEQNIGHLLKDIQNQEWKNFEVLIFNDQSDDKTGEIVESYTKEDQRIHLINSEGLPDGWLGKNYGCYQLAQKAKGNYFLFLDADVRISGAIISGTIAKVKKHQLGLLSIFPKQNMYSWGEYLTVPNMNFILLSLLPLVFVRVLPFSSMAAANGQFMLFDANTYRKNQPHQTFRDNKVEDISTARLFKQKGIKIACLAGNHSITCRMYSSFNEAVNGFSKNVIMFFGDSGIVAVFFWLITTLGFIPVLIAFPNELGYTYFFMLIAIRVLITFVSHQNPFKNLVLAIPQQVVLGLFILKAFLNKSKKTYQWKGRNIS